MGMHTWNWYRAWLPNSEAANRKPLLRMQMEAHGVMVSKYLTFTSDTASPANTSDTLYRSPYSLCAHAFTPELRLRLG